MSSKTTSTTIVHCPTSTMVGDSCSLHVILYPQNESEYRQCIDVLLKYAEIHDATIKDKTGDGGTIYVDAFGVGSIVINGHSEKLIEYAKAMSASIV